MNLRAKIRLVWLDWCGRNKTLEGLTSKVFKRNVDKKDKFKESARDSTISNELNSTVAELQNES